MAKITFDSVVSGFKSVAQIVANFDSVATELNSKVLYRDNPEGEPNQMENNLDMNSNRILNLPTAIGSGEPITLAQAIDIVTEINGGGSGGSSLYYSTEFITLLDGQVQVQFDTDTTLSNFSISGSSADNGKIFEGQDYSISHSIRTLTLNNSYPEGTVIARYREGSDTSLTPEDAAVSAQAAEDWAIYPEDTLVPTVSGGNNVDEYSAKHWASKSIQEAGLSLPLTGGTLTGDLEIESATTDSSLYVLNSGGGLRARSFGADSYFYTTDLNGFSPLEMMKFTDAAGVTLNYNGAVKLDTSATGVAVTGAIAATGNVVSNNGAATGAVLVMRGSGGGLQMYSNATSTYLQTVDAAGVNAQIALRAIRDGATYLYENGIAKLGTTNAGAHIYGELTVASGLNATGDSTITGDLTVQNTDGLMTIKDDTNGGANAAYKLAFDDAANVERASISSVLGSDTLVVDSLGAVSLNYIGATKLTTSNIGTTTTGSSLATDGVTASYIDYAGLYTNRVASYVRNTVAGGSLYLNAEASIQFSIGAGPETLTLDMVSQKADFEGDISVNGTAAVWSSGTGTPEAVVTAPVGSMFTRTDGGAGTTLYVKETGVSNTGWVAK